MSILGSLFGNENVVKKTVDGIYNGIDAVVYTEEERKENFQKLLKLYEPFKIAQRFLALIFGIPYAAAWFITFCVSFTDHNIEPQLELLSGTMGSVVLAIIGFYFLGGAAEGLVRKNK
ncbi:hypothetical protein [Bacterioplanoides sp.]|uniref:hypothetical protein n=1 Tax=Bacterioplanoides sp. TaxID=2066072 RepID=UPI003B008E04